MLLCRPYNWSHNTDPWVVSAPHVLSITSAYLVTVGKEEHSNGGLQQEHQQQQHKEL